MVQLARKVLKNLAYNSSGVLIGNVAGLILTIILARLLTTAGTVWYLSVFLKIGYRIYL